jgi:hypothetical protein
MDTYRGYLTNEPEDDGVPGALDRSYEEPRREPPPLAIGQDERRMQVRAYNHWASQLDGRNYPSIEALEPDKLTDFGPYGVLLDFTGGIEDPAVQFIGERLADECEATGPIARLSDVPPRSLLSRITDHYMQIIANQAPIGFEAEFVNARGLTVAYRGILLPYSSDDDTIDFIYGVINWKELADQKTTDDLLEAIDQALEAKPAPSPVEPIAGWADGPLGDAADDEEDEDEDDVLDLVAAVEDDEEDEDEDEDEPAGLPRPQFGSLIRSVRSAPIEVEDAFELDASFEAVEAETAVPTIDDALELDAVIEADAAGTGDFAQAIPAVTVPYEPTPPTIELEVELDPAEMELGDWLASARELAQAAKGSEDRTRNALYAAIGRAYDFALAADEAPEEFTELVVESGLTVQDRAPMTPVVKLVFGADYDKTRLTEYAAALGHAQRIGLARGELAGYLGSASGGLKGVVTEERRLRREDAGKPASQRETPREALARKLRRLDHAPLDAVAVEGAEFTLLVARRLPTGEVVLLGEIADDIPLLERAARKLLI